MNSRLIAYLRAARISDMISSPRFLVIQNGARHGYAVPLALNRRGALAGVYTDIVATRGLGALASHVFQKSGNVAGALRRRTPPEEIASMVRSFDFAYMVGTVAQTFAGRDLGIRIANHLAEGAMAASGTAGATHLYTMFGEGGEFVKSAKEAGLGVVGDVYIALSADQIVAEEARRFPDWSDTVPALTTPEDRIALNETLLFHSDVLICPSQFVKDDLIRHGIDPQRMLIVPYGVSSRFLALATNPEPGRVLFAGTASLRKGIHYLAATARILKGRCRVLVAGGVSEKIRRHPGATELEFLGHLGPVRMAEEFACADVFAFPSLAEGSAGVTAEALGAGVPVVTTKAAGSIVRDGVDGYIIPERDPEALANAIWSVVENRSRRAVMSQAARERAQEVSWDSFATTVIEAASTPASGYPLPSE